MVQTRRSLYWNMRIIYSSIILHLNCCVMSMRTHTAKPIHMALLLLATVLCVRSADILTKEFKIATSPIISNTGRQNISICFADCDSCQSRTGECEKCFAPWYQLNAGRCVLSSPSYFLQSTEEEQRWNNFIASSEWLYNGVPVTSRVCVPNTQTLTQNFTTIGPFGSGNVVYQRTISQHNYFGIKFLLLMTNWTSNETSLRVRITNQANTVIEQQVLTLSTPAIGNAYIEQLCSSTPLDRRASITLMVQEEQSSQLMIQFIGNMPAGASWSLSSFVLITGSCNASCSTCSGYTPRLSGCDMCKNFLVNDESAGGEKCSICTGGFALRPAQNRCYKCPIQFKQCRFNQTNGTVCQFPQISNQNAQCTLVNSSFFDNKQLTQDIFYGSLYSIQNKGSITTRCGVYSVVGPASFGDIISRNFVLLPIHIQMSINFNLFIFDQQQKTQRYSIVVIVDGQPIQFGQTQQTINITGISNECDVNPPLVKLEAMKTFETSTFIKHKKTENVVIGVSLGTSANLGRTSWGVRDIRLVFKRCDQSCQTCTQNGCEKCRGLFQLSDLQCSNCLVGTGVAPNNSTCVACPQNCLQCNFTNTSIKCTSCVAGFYMYELNNMTSCEPNPNFGTPVSGRLTQMGGCTVAVPSNPNRTYNFDVAENRARKIFTMPRGSTGKNIQFYLMKLDNWEGDYLDIYANDLLVKRLQMGASGNSYCGAANQNDQMTLQQFDIDDNNQTLTLQFEAVHKDTTKTRRFGVADLKVYPVGCTECKSYDFLYRAKYNYDERLFVELAFNLIYENNNPDEFKNIFKLKAGQRYLDYQISANDSIRYWLKSQRIPDGEILDQNVTVECRYPLRVIAKIPTNSTNGGYVQSINKYQFFDRRMLQVFNPNYQNVKTLDNNLASVLVDRFTPLKGRESSVLGLQTFFSVVTRMVIYLGFASFFFGCQTPCTHVMHNIQKLWVHIFVASLALSPVLKTALWGFRQSQDQNIAINPNQWESGLPPYLYYDAPAQYQHYHKDITFFRHIYNVGTAFAILIFVYFVFKFIFGRFKKSENLFIRHMRNTFVYRTLWFFNSIIFYQYFTVVLACFMQFLDLKTRTNQPAFAGVNAAACIIAFIFATLYPIIIHLVLNRKRNTSMSLLQTIMMNMRNKQFDTIENDVHDLHEQAVIYNNKYSQIFYRFLPKQLWHSNLQDSEMISQKHFFYNIFRFGDLWWHALVVILLWHSPFAQAFLLMLTNGFHLAVNTFATLNTTKYFRILKSLELVFFIVLEILIIVMNSLLKTLRFESYETLGVVSLIFVFFILAVTIIRFFYTLYRLFKQYRRTNQQDINRVIRTDAGYKRGWARDFYINP